MRDPVIKFRLFNEANKAEVRDIAPSTLKRNINVPYFREQSLLSSSSHVTIQGINCAIYESSG